MLFALTLWKEIRRQFRQPHRLIIWLALPVALTTIIGLAFGGGRSGATTHITVAVVDEDTGWIGRLLGLSLEAITNDFIETRMMKRPIAEKSLRTSRDLAGMILIPKGAQDALLRAQKSEWFWTPNPQMVVFPAVAYEALQQVAAMAGGFSAAFQEPVSLIQEGDQNLDPVERSRRISESFRKTFDSVADVWYPPAVNLKVERPPNPDEESPLLFDLFRSVFPPLILYSLFFVCQGLTRSLVRERKEGTLARLLASPLPFTSYYLASQAAFVVFALLIFVILMVFGILVYHLVPVHPVLTLLAVLASVWCFLSFVGFLYGIARTERGAGAFAELLGTLLALVGGVFFPIPPDSAFLSRLSEFSFLRWGARALSHAINGDPLSAPTFAQYLLRLAIAGTFFAFLAALTLRRKLLAGSARLYA